MRVLFVSGSIFPHLFFHLTLLLYLVPSLPLSRISPSLCPSLWLVGKAMAQGGGRAAGWRRSGPRDRLVRRHNKGGKVGRSSRPATGGAEGRRWAELGAASDGAVLLAVRRGPATGWSGGAGCAATGEVASAGLVVAVRGGVRGRRRRRRG